MQDKISAAAEFLAPQIKGKADTAIILGSGLGVLAEQIETIAEWRYADIPGFPVSTVEGHAGKLIFGRMGDKTVVAMDGRFHYYEGWTMQQVTLPVRVFGELGISRLFVSNAAGGTNPDFRPGDIMIITDHINFLPESPLRGANLPCGPRFPDMSEPYDHELIRQADSIAAENGIALRHGVYLADQGPAYETPAEYRMYRLLGADAVGMSTVPEVIAARHQGMRVFGASVITNVPSRSDGQPTTHEEVQRAAEEAGPKMSLLFKLLLNA